MKRKIVLIACLLLAVSVSACSSPNIEENIPFGEIDTSKEYVEPIKELPSVVERKKPVDINDYFMKIPLEETAEKQTAPIPTVWGNKYQIERVQYNGVYFDINQIANQRDYKLVNADGLIQLIIPMDDETPIIASVAQIADASYMDLSKRMTYEETQEVYQIVEEYNQIYRDTENQTSDEYGYYFTYDKYVEWMQSHENSKYDITMYSPEQILQLAIDTFGLDKNVEDFYSNVRADMLECSDWYMVKMSFRYEKEGEEIIEISVKSSSEGIFLFMTQYSNGENVDENGMIYFTPTMIINIAQNNYFQLAEDVETKNNRENYENGFY